MRKEKDDEFSSLFQNEPEYKFDSFIVECFICQEDKKPYETIQPFEASLDNIEINDSHELNIVGAMVDDVVVLRGGFDEDKADLKIVSEEEIVESADSDDEVEDTTEIAHAYWTNTTVDYLDEFAVDYGIVVSMETVQKVVGCPYLNYKYIRMIQYVYLVFMKMRSI